MRLYVGVTDGDWFCQLQALQPDEVNFWRPGARSNFRVLQPGEPFLFKLHSPRNFVVGGGFFVAYSRLPVSAAWLAFGEKNGVTDPFAFRERIRHYRRDAAKSPDPQVGCVILRDPFFFEESAWIPIPPDWSANIVQGKSYSTDEPLGAALWAQVQSRLADAGTQQAALSTQEALFPAPTPDGETARHGAPHEARPRLGQGAFRVLVTDAYGRRCAVTGERTLPVLEASHIQPYGQQGPHAVSNGLLLRADLHILFDRGYLGLDEINRLLVSRKIREEYDNGRHYYALEGQALALPQRPDDRPDPGFVTWHRERVFVP